MVSVLNGDV